MDYDPVKDRLGALFNRSHTSQRAFYRLLDLFFLRAWYVQRELARIVSALPRDRSVDVLDAGTGFGQYAWHLARNYPHLRITALDVKEDYLENARRFVGRTPHADRVTFCLGDLTKLEVTSEYDLILSVDVMEHIEEDELVFRNFARALRSGGYVLINTPSDQGGSDVGAGGGESFIGEHVRDGYNMRDLEQKLERAGLKIDRSLYTYGKAGSAAWRMLIKYPIRMLNASRASIAILPLYYLPVFPVGMLLHAVDVRGRHSSGTGLVVVARKP